jgi:mannosyl-3-phosphoglycerate phosphatase
MNVVFTDLDGTLLDRETYGFEEALPAVRNLLAAGVPLIPVTSKTRAETEWWRGRLGLRGPYVVENGGAALIPAGTFPFATPEKIEFGEPYAALREALAAASAASGCRVRGFGDMTVEEIARAAGLPAGQAALAARREYDEPFAVLDPGREERLVAEIEARGKRWTRGGRFHHILGGNDKGAAVVELLALYRRAFGSIWATGLGDGWNDLEFLRLMDRAVVIESPEAERLAARLPGAVRTSRAGPAGWNEAFAGSGKPEA